MKSISEAADTLAIIEVCTRMHWCVDHRDWEGLVDLLDDHVSFPTPSESAEPDFDAKDFIRSRDEVLAAYPVLLAGVLTQHLIAGHVVEVHGDKAVCLAHSINAHIFEGDPSAAPVFHGNDYRFELVRTDDGWRVCGRQTWIRWRWGNERNYDVDSRLSTWAKSMPPAGSAAN